MNIATLTCTASSLTAFDGWIGILKRQIASATSTSIYGDNRALKGISFLYDEQGHGLHRPVRLRKVDAVARAQPNVRSVPEPARQGEVISTARTSSTPAGPEPASRAVRHGVPEADAVPDDDLREYRLRHPALREAVQSGDRRPRGGLAAPGGPVGRGQGQARDQRPQPLRRPAAAPVHRPHHRGAARGDPDRRAVLGARPDLDRARSRS